MTPKLLLKSVLQNFGYQMRKVPKVADRRMASLHLDAMADQKFLAGERARTIFDIGAHVGETAAAYRREFHEAFVYSFEPFTASYQQLEQTARLDTQVNSFNVAVGDQPGKQTLYYTDFSPTNSLLRLQADSTDFLAEAAPQAQKSCEVEVTTLDQFCTAHGVEQIDICKMDVQGAELKVLQGAKQLLSEARIGLVYLEVNFNPYYEQQASFAQVYEFLYSHGFTLFGLYDLNHGKKNLRLTESNAIFIGERIGSRLSA